MIIVFSASQLPEEQTRSEHHLETIGSPSPETADTKGKTMAQGAVLAEYMCMFMCFFLFVFSCGGGGAGGRGGSRGWGLLSFILYMCFLFGEGGEAFEPPLRSIFLKLVFVLDII